MPKEQIRLDAEVNFTPEFSKSDGEMTIPIKLYFDKRDNKEFSGLEAHALNCLERARYVTINSNGRRLPIQKHDTIVIYADPGVPSWAENECIQAKRIDVTAGGGNTVVATYYHYWARR